MTNDVQSVPRPRESRKHRLAGLGLGLGDLALVGASAGFTAILPRFAPSR
jgi:hypothetical protein